MVIFSYLLLIVILKLLILKWLFLVVRLYFRAIYETSGVWFTGDFLKYFRIKLHVKCSNNLALRTASWCSFMVGDI